MRSFGPPAGNGTISLIGLLGKSWAAAIAGPSNNPVSSARRNFIRVSRRRFFANCPHSLRMGRQYALAVEQLDRGFMHPRVAGRDDAAAALGGLAVPGGDD